LDGGGRDDRQHLLIIYFGMLGSAPRPFDPAGLFRLDKFAFRQAVGVLALIRHRKVPPQVTLSHRRPVGLTDVKAAIGGRDSVIYTGSPQRRARRSAFKYSVVGVRLANSTRIILLVGGHCTVHLAHVHLYLPRGPALRAEAMQHHIGKAGAPDGIVGQLKRPCAVNVLPQRGVVGYQLRQGMQSAQHATITAQAMLVRYDREEGRQGEEAKW